MADEIVIPTIVLGKLGAGIKGGSREKENLLELEAFLATPRVSIHSLGEETAIFYAEIFAALRAAGKPIPTNDLRIAASTFKTGSILHSNDAHFDVV